MQNASYELSLGNEVYTNSDGAKTILNKENPQFELKPGQFAVLITEEEIEIPPKYIGFISLKFSIKFRGLVNISGFHVDPGFEGKLKFSVYNAGSNSIIFEYQKPYFVLWMAQLTEELKGKERYDGTHQHQNEITAKDVMNIKGDIASPNELLEKIEKLESNLDWRKWINRIIVGILITIAIKTLWDWDARKKGYHDAIQKIENYKVEENRLKKDMIFVVDSILQSRQKQDSISK